MRIWQLALVMWLIVGVTVAGAGVLAVLTVPELSARSGELIPLVAGSGFAIAFGLSLILAYWIKRPHVRRA